MATNLTLDAHTAQFFAPDYHSAPVEKSLRSTTTPSRRFSGRLAPLLTGMWVAIVREDKTRDVEGRVTGGMCFVLEAHPNAHFGGVPSLEQEEELWRKALSFNSGAFPSGRPTDPLPLNFWGLHRFHFDRGSGFGCRISLSGWWEFLDLRGPQIRERNDEDTSLFVGLQGAWLGENSFRAGQWALLTTSDAHFHRQADVMLRDVEGELFQTLRFYQLSEDSQCWETMGCNPTTRARATEILKRELIIAMDEDAQLQTYDEVHWYPWCQRRRMRGRIVDTWTLIDVPPSLEAKRRDVFTELGCSPSPLSFREGRKIGHRAYKVRQEWARQLVCKCPKPSGHELAEAHWQLEELRK